VSAADRNKNRQTDWPQQVSCLHLEHMANNKIIYKPIRNWCDSNWIFLIRDCFCSCIIISWGYTQNLSKNISNI